MEDVTNLTQPAQTENESINVDEIKTVEEWAEVLETPLWLVYAARIKYSWPYGQPLTREAFERAIAGVKTLEVK